MARPRRRLAPAVLALATVAALTAPAAAARLAAPAPPVGRIVVTVPGALDAAVTAAARLPGAVVTDVWRTALTGFAVTLPATAADGLAALPGVRFAAPDLPVSVEPLDYAYSVAPVGPQRVPHGVLRIKAGLSRQHAADAKAPAKGRPGVAVIDTGVAPHPDLHVAGGYDCVDRTSYADVNGHGTHVAGTVAAIDDAAGVVGVAPGAPVYAVRVFGPTGSGPVSRLICGLDWVSRNAARIKVANVSLGGTGAADDGACGYRALDPVHVAVCGTVRRGVVIVAAAGNGSSDPVEAGLPGGEPLVHDFRATVPAAYGEVLAVTAMNDFDGAPGARSPVATCGTSAPDDAAAPYSNFTMAGSPTALHTVAGPGTCVLSTFFDTAKKQAGYAMLDGTSMAAPHVAGLVLLCIESGRCRGLSPAGVSKKLVTAARAAAKAYSYDGSPRTPHFDATARGYRWYGDLVTADGVG
jgi:hypothetical protein